MLTYAHLTSGLGSSLRTTLGTHDLLIERAVADSRLCRPGDLFVALPGETLDGGAFVEDAFARGATAVLTARADVSVPPGRTLLQVDRPLAALHRLAGWWRGQLEPEVVAITGTTGKTSTKEVTAHLLAARGERLLKTEASLNGDIGLPLMLLRLRPDHEVAVLELGLFTAGEITLQCELARPRLGIVTNVGYTHAERLGSIEAIARAKRELVDWLPTDSVVALNVDDARVAAMRPHARGRVVSYALEQDADLTATDIQDYGLRGMAYRLVTGSASVAVRTPLIGRHNISNALAAIAMAMARCITLPEIAERLASASNDLRLTVLHAPSGALVIDDAYNANPASMAAALAVLAAEPGRRVVVLGDMLELGDQERRLHAELGESAARVGDVLFFTGPRGRWSADAARGVGHADVRYVESREALAAAVRAEVGAGDVVLVKASRGLALESIVAALMQQSEPSAPSAGAAAARAAVS